MISLSAIAKRSGVSVATVSLALRGKPVARSTGDKVRKIAEEMGYRPNPLLASLATKRFRSASSAGGAPLAILHFPEQGDKSDGRVKYSELSDSLMSEAKNLGYAPEIHRLTNSSKTAPLSRTLYHGMVQGIIIHGSMDMAKFGDAFDWSHYAVVACGRFRTSLPFHTVRVNVFKSVKKVFAELLERGYRRIGFAMGRHDESMEDDESRYGAARSMELNYMSARQNLSVYSGPLVEKAPFLQWVKKSKPDAVVGFNDLRYWHLRDAGYRMPEDLGFASLHLDEALNHNFCSGLYAMNDEIARQSVLLLDQFIRNREQGRPENPMDLLLTPTWHEGKTLQPRP